MDSVMTEKFTSPPGRLEFNQRVWELVRQIPPGKVSTYGRIANLLTPPAGIDPSQYRAFGPRWVGGAMAACPSDVPWQRVINSQGKISLGKGSGESHQRQLLEEEGVIFDDRERVDLKIYKRRIQQLVLRISSPFPSKIRRINMATNYPVNPRVRAYGKARIDIAQRAKTSQDWEDLWKQPVVSFPFTWGNPWKQCIEYKVDDFAAEVGFYIDILGLPVNAFDPDYAMFTSPRADFFFSVVPTPAGLSSTPPNAIRIQFMVDDILSTADELQSRGIFFDQPPQPCQPGSSLYIACFRTPNGITIDLWGAVKQEQGHISYEDAETELSFTR
jgi:methylated-DNA-protein-cysteine methyltransferase-like protein